ncbi:MAG: RdgB/HAM1 family non-canonical purine NTP pyrophosphatase [Propionibacteriaceae bacterium]|nr:RdgB/HAM1 family non-canonical purine NTP pyrophosphatase [Propionibacteriaceae bacterium]
MTGQLLLASGNAHKLAELRRLTAGLDLAILGLADVTPYPEPAETGATFEANALIKAAAGAAATGLPTLADDSGIEVDVLNGMPGVRSARWAGVGATDAENLDLLIRQLADVEDERRGCRFVCAVALVWPAQPGVQRDPVVLRRAVEGTALRRPRGSNGFGYDPIFLPVGHDRTTAEMSAAEKDAISHRGQALRAILPDLAALAVG